MWVYLFFVPSVVLSVPVQNQDSCEAARKAGVNMTTYVVDVAHGVHSISVEDIRYFFDNQFPVNNTVPTTNLNLTGPPVLLFAPSRPSDFKMPGGAAVDYILANNDDPLTFSQAGKTTLEEIVHQMHMIEMWNKASKLYKDIISRNLNTQEVCTCLVDEKEPVLISAMYTFSEDFHNTIPEPIINGERRIPLGKSRELGGNKDTKKSVEADHSKVNKIKQ